MKIMVGSIWILLFWLSATCINAQVADTTVSTGIWQEDAFGVLMSQCHSQGAEITLELHARERLLHIRNPHHARMEAVVHVLEPALTSLCREGKHTLPFDTVFLGRWVDWGDGEVCLLMQAAGDPGWRGNGATTQRRVLDARADEVVQLFNQGSCLDPFVRLFAMWGYGVQVSSVEKVLVVEASRSRAWAELQRQGVEPDQLLPHDAMVYLSLEKLDDDLEP